MNLQTATPEVLRAIVEMEREKSDNFFAKNVELVDRLNESHLQHTAWLNERADLMKGCAEYGKVLEKALETIDWAITYARRAGDQNHFISWSDRRIGIAAEANRLNKEIWK